MGDVSPFGMGDKEAAGCLSFLGTMFAVILFVIFGISLLMTYCLSNNKVINSGNNRIERVHDSLEFLRLKQKLNK